MPRASSYSAWLVAAIAVHAALLLAHWPVTAPQYSVGASETVELTLLESAPAAPANAAPMPLPEPPAPEPAAVAPSPEPVSREMPQPLATPTMPRSRSTSPAAPARPKAVPGNAIESRSAGATADTRPAYLYNPHPPYPPASRQAGEQGVVLLAVSINERGEVTAVGVKQSSGSRRLDDAARTGVARWRFRSGRVAGFPVASKIEVPVRFRLSD